MDKAAPERVAALLLRRFGAQAEAQIQRRIAGHMSYGELECYRRWSQVLSAMRSMSRKG